MFHAEKELTAPYTSNNKVTALIDGKQYMSDLCREIRLLGDQDFVLIAGWEFWQYRSLAGRVTNKSHPFGGDRRLALDNNGDILINGKVGIATNRPGATLAIDGGLHVGGESNPGDKNQLVGL
jgi:hypothetical protein